MGILRRRERSMQPHSFTVQLFSVLTARHRCTDSLENKTVIFEYSYYPGYRLSSSASLVWDGDLGENDSWKVTNCGDQVCLRSKEGLLTVKKSQGIQNRLGVMIAEAKSDEDWSNRFDIMCIDCEKSARSSTSTWVVARERRKVE